ncbi:Sop4p ASCRUDRAFT_7487 [Ascoidea rubescens DSM 1968]|uniref:Protein SOP4 n=1 Tax=Ascoidea rubescens DSM 1968 TaxID=1344418 RepID=A0A1D2VKC8_9ASCO|nr:hypothetical protein ASCRUDRAFT_7487 [Ascoidea rubescens DSM 1968]ODV62053.1 hypothetical protein ASCRUDRAFT_7487 [Ascoidea rubescens DSM 1968]
MLIPSRELHPSSDNIEFRVPLRHDGSFKTLQDLSIGDYLLTVSSTDYNFDKDRFVVLINETQDASNNNITITAYENELGHRYNDLIEVDYPLNITLNQKNPLRKYYEPKNKGITTSGPIAGLLNSKLALFGTVSSIILLIGFNYIQKLDPDFLKDLQNDYSNLQQVVAQNKNPKNSQRPALPTKVKSKRN